MAHAKQHHKFESVNGILLIFSAVGLLLLLGYHIIHTIITSQFCGLVKVPPFAQILQIDHAFPDSRMLESTDEIQTNLLVSRHVSMLYVIAKHFVR